MYDLAGYDATTVRFALGVGTICPAFTFSRYASACRWLLAVRMLYSVFCNVWLPPNSCSPGTMFRPNPTGPITTVWAVGS